MPRKRKADEFVIANLQSLAKDRNTPVYYRVFCTILLANIAKLTDLRLNFMPGTRSKAPDVPAAPDAPEAPQGESDPDIDKALAQFKNSGGA